MNVDQLLAIVADLTMFTTTEQLEHRLSQCRTVYDELQHMEDSSGQSEAWKAEMLLAAIARIQNKIAAIKFSERPSSRRALDAAARIPRERFTTTVVRPHR